MVGDSVLRGTFSHSLAAFLSWRGVQMYPKALPNIKDLPFIQCYCVARRETQRP